MKLQMACIAGLTGLMATVAQAGVLELGWDAELDATFPAHGRSVAADDAGNVYVTGDVGTSLSINDWVTKKYDTAGNLIWTRSFDGPAGKNDVPYHIQLDPAGNVYVGGISYTGGDFGQGPKFDIVIFKYNPQGDVLWQHTFNSSYNNDDFIEDMVVMPDGSVYVVGYSYTPVGQSPDADYVVYRLSPTGQMMWSTFWDGPFDRVYWLGAKAEADATGVSIAATTEKLIGPNDADDVNIFSFVKFSPTGAQLAEGYWEPPYNELLPDTNWLHDAAMDSNGNLIAVGRYDGPYTSSGPDEPARAIAIKFAPNGDVVWVAENDTPLSDAFDRVVIDGQDNVFIAGTYNVQGQITTHADHVTIAFDANGQFMWDHRFGTDGMFDGEGYAQINDAGELLVATGFYAAEYNEDIRFLRYDRMTGTLLDSFTYDHGSCNDRILGLTLDPNGNMVITGWTTDYLPGGGIEGANLLVAKVMGGPTTTPGDLNGDGAVDVFDLFELLGAWGNCTGDCPADLNSDGVIDVFDLFILLGAWS